MDYHHNHHHNMHHHHHLGSATNSNSNNISTSLAPSSSSAINQLSSVHLIDQSGTQSTPFNTPSSITITNNTLARIFSILLKLIRELLAETVVSKKCTKQATTTSKTSTDYRRLVKRLHQKLDMPWKWLVTIMDATESQLRFGASLSASQSSELSTSATKFLRHLEEKALLTNYFSNSQTGTGGGGSSGTSSNAAGGYYGSGGGAGVGGGGPFISSRFGSGIDARRKLTIMQHQHQQFSSLNATGSSHPSIISSNPTSGGVGSANSHASAALLAAQFASNQVIASRRDFMTYTLSLMRTYTNEHRDFLPTVDISLLKHVAYAFDGLMFYLRMTKWPLVDEKAWYVSTFC